ncbi:hypothetical protein BDQ17DRAFT_1370875 [Cyathus striatus]|nr:hypothetical protein BDQ17DRAFT_1374858 [Cyathus striatus]KAF8991344.1 hypothetical protein BDQ17DRAFT_1370875 [Cyathus striatus]
MREDKYGGQSHLTRVVYRDGAVYYIYIFIFSLANITVGLKLPQYAVLLAIPQRAVHSVLACRVVLHVRKQALRDSFEGVHSISLTTIRVEDSFVAREE